MPDLGCSQQSEMHPPLDSATTLAGNYRGVWLRAGYTVTRGVTILRRVNKGQ